MLRHVVPPELGGKPSARSSTNWATTWGMRWVETKEPLTSCQRLPAAVTVLSRQRAEYPNSSRLLNDSVFSCRWSWSSVSCPGPKINIGQIFTSRMSKQERHEYDMGVWVQSAINADKIGKTRLFPPNQRSIFGSLRQPASFIRSLPARPAPPANPPSENPP